MSMFVYLVLPSLDIITGLLFTNSLFLLPSLCCALGNRHQATGKFRQPIYLGALAIQSAALVVWPVLVWWQDHINSNQSDPLFRDNVSLTWWAIPVSGVLISLGYWENFTTENISLKCFR